MQPFTASTEQVCTSAQTFNPNSQGYWPWRLCMAHSMRLWEAVMGAAPLAKAQSSPSRLRSFPFGGPDDLLTRFITCSRLPRLWVF